MPELGRPLRVGALEGTNTLDSAFLRLASLVLFREVMLGGSAAVLGPAATTAAGVPLLLWQFVDLCPREVWWQPVGRSAEAAPGLPPRSGPGLPPRINSGRVLPSQIKASQPLAACDPGRIAAN